MFKVNDTTHRVSIAGYREGEVLVTETVKVISEPKPIGKLGILWVEVEVIATTDERSTRIGITTAIPADEGQLEAANGVMVQAFKGTRA